MTKENKTTKVSRVASQKIAPIRPSNVIFNLSFLKPKGGEMYGM